ncbi:MAG: SlyX family protein [Pasteurellaceae bacterium]|nr:SlyX family protein [Pasteurellaceae bacterium]
MQNSEKISKRLAELEMKLTFQDNLLEQLNQVLIDQQFAIDKLQVQVRYLVGKLKDLQPSQIASQAEETPPPHY